MKAKTIDYSDEQKHGAYIKNFVSIYGEMGQSKNFEGCKNRLNDICTGAYYLDDDMIWYTYIDHKDGKEYDSTLVPERILELNAITKQKRGI